MPKIIKCHYCGKERVVTPAYYDRVMSRKPTGYSCKECWNKNENMKGTHYEIHNKIVTSEKHRNKLSKTLKGISHGLMSEEQKNILKTFRGNKHHAWKGDIKYSRGYKFITINNERVSEQSEIIKKYFGRYPIKPELIHHINLIRDDNNIQNLMLLKNRAAHRRIHWATQKEGDIIFNGRTVTNLKGGSCES